MVGGGSINSTSVFAVLDSLKKSDKSSKGSLKKSGLIKESEVACVFWPSSALEGKSWADVDDDDDYYSTAALPPSALGSSEQSHQQDKEIAGSVIKEISWGQGRKHSNSTLARASPAHKPPTAPPSSSSNGTILTRNLRKSDLGGVIFGCRHSTMQECLSKQLFGSQHGHFSYVRNIEEGLPLFLFNYSDRKLHGVYKAASHGQMSFDAYAWTDGGTERTPFPAQVYIRIRTQCQPLTENQFSKIIADNYFSYQHFWFELDHAQARGLMALFKPLPADVVLSPVAPLGRNVFLHYQPINGFR